MMKRVKEIIYGSEALSIIFILFQMEFKAPDLRNE